MTRFILYVGFIIFFFGLPAMLAYVVGVPFYNVFIPFMAMHIIDLKFEKAFPEVENKETKNEE